MKPRTIAFALFLSGILFGLASLAFLQPATHLHTPGSNILHTPELESIVKDNPKLLQKLHDEDDAARGKINTLIGAQFQVCIILAVSGAFQIVAGLLLDRGLRKRGGSL
jgi:hypothetical protein